MKKTKSIAMILSLIILLGIMLLTSCSQSSTNTKPENSLDPKENSLDPKKEALRNIKVGDVITFGKYEQDNNTSNGKEEIEWNVLAIENGKALVISKYILDSHNHEQIYIPVSSTNKPTYHWEDSSLRNWLGNTFLKNSFSEEENKVIELTTIESWGWGVNDKTTQDKIFILDSDELEKYLTTKSLRNCNATEFAKANGLNHQMWYFRGCGYSSHYASLTKYNPQNDDVDVKGNYKSYGVRPAMWININN